MVSCPTSQQQHYLGKIYAFYMKLSKLKNYRQQGKFIVLSTLGLPKIVQLRRYGTTTLIFFQCFWRWICQNWILPGGLCWKSSLASPLCMCQTIWVLLNWFGFREVSLQNFLLNTPLNSTRFQKFHGTEQIASLLR